MNEQSREARKIFSVADRVNAYSYFSRRQLIDRVYRILQKYNPQSDSRKLSERALEIAYIYVHNLTDTSQRHIEQTEAVLSK